MIYADDVNILDGREHTIKKNTEALVVASKIGLEVNAEDILIDNSYSERVEEFKYLGITLFTHPLHGAESFLRS